MHLFYHLGLRQVHEKCIVVGIFNNMNFNVSTLVNTQGGKFLDWSH